MMRRSAKNRTPAVVHLCEDKSATVFNRSPTRLPGLSYWSQARWMPAVGADSYRTYALLRLNLEPDRVGHRGRGVSPEIPIGAFYIVAVICEFFRISAVSNTTDMAE